MRSLSALLIIGFVAVSAIQPYSWTPSKEYRYKYSSQVLTGIPELNSQYSGLRLTSTVRIQPKHDSTCRIQLEQPRLVTYNDKLEWERNMKPTSGHEQSLPGQVKTWLETPFTVFHKRGLVEKIETENGEPEFIVNLKKGLISQIQMDLSQTSQGGYTNQIQRGDNQEVLPVFESHETTVLGKCETVYTISKLPQHMVMELEQTELIKDSHCEGKEHFEILKTKNLDNCVNRPVYHKSFGSWPKSDGSKAFSFPAQTSVTRTIVCGSLEDHYIRKSVTKNQILVGSTEEFETKEQIDISSISTLELESVQNVQREISGPSSPKGYPSLVYEYPSGSQSSSRSLKQELLQQSNQQQQQMKHAPLPGLTSAPKVFFPNEASQRELKQKAVELFTEMIESTKHITESMPSKKDSAGLSVNTAKILSMLSLEELKEVEQTVMSQVRGNMKPTTIKKVFFDLVSIAGTNPCMMLIKEKVTSGEIMQEPTAWSWILSNALRNIKTPTPELLRELVQLLKSEHIQRNRIIRAAYTMGLTDIINKACINPESVENQFAYRIYGQMCHKETEVIKGELIPFLSQKLQESSRGDMNAVITYVYALGNLGVEETSQELMKVIEGKIPTHHHVKALAVYKLIRPAMVNPALYRPIFTSLIENSAENEQVRMAAITALTYASPSSADLQKLALRTWFEPSQQVSSFIYSTLWSLSKLSGSVPVYESLKNKAQIILPIAKNTRSGFQYSHNLQYTTFVETLKTALSHKLQWVASQDSFIPRTIYAKTELLSQSRNIDVVETMLYMQGSETILKQLYDLAWQMGSRRSQSHVSQNEREVEEIISKLGIKNKHEERPEAHVYLKFLGQKLYSVDAELIERVVRKLSTEFMEDLSELERGMEFEYMKVLDPYGAEWALPTETGMPVNIFIKHPIVAHNKAEVKTLSTSTSHPVVEIELKGVFNIKRQVHVGIMTPLTGKYHGAGLETSVAVATPLKAVLSGRKGQVQITLKQLEQQNEQTLLEYNVLPFTFTQELNEWTLASKSGNAKTIRSRSNEIQKEIQIGKPFGLDVEAKITTEETGMDLYRLIGDLYYKAPGIPTTLSTPVGTGKRTHIKIVHSPRNSQVQELVLNLSVDAGMRSQDQQVQMFLTPSHHHIEMCREEKRSCIQHMERQNLPSYEVERTCERKYELCYQSVELKQQLSQQLQKITTGYGAAVSISAALKGRQTSEERKIETHFTIAHKPEGRGHEQTHTSLKVIVETPMLRQPYEVQIQSETETKKPGQKWNWEQILREDLTSKIHITGEYGHKGQEKKQIKATLELIKSEKQKEFVRRSHEHQKCTRQQSEGKLLTKSCKNLRLMADSLDTLKGKITLPNEIAQSKIAQYATEIAKIAVLPYLSQQTAGRQHSGSYQEYEIKARVNGHGDALFVKIAGNGEEVEVQNVRLGKVGQTLFPISSQESLPTKVLQRLTSYNLPSTCSVESGKVQTFDKFEYTYPLNDCEHVVFSERSTRPRVLVTTRRDQVKQHIKMVVDGHKMEVEINKESRYSRDSSAVFKVNGQVQQWSSLEGKMYEEEIFVTRYMDGVYSLYSPKYGVEVIADGERMEVKSPQHIFRNRVTGICGDLNGEWVADIKSTRQCITPKPKTSAYSFLIENGKCQGIPHQEKSELQREEQRCVREEEISTQVTHIFRQLKESRPHPEQMHIVKELRGETCFSKNLIRVCSRSHPKEVGSKQVGFVCVSGPKAEIFKRRVLAGDLVDEFEYLPTKFVKTVYEPRQC